jgi:hypothetical protein
LVGWGGALRWVTKAASVHFYVFTLPRAGEWVVQIFESEPLPVWEWYEEEAQMP